MKQATLILLLTIPCIVGGTDANQPISGYIENESITIPADSNGLAESVGIATGFLIAALHKAGLSVLTHTPNPMNFLTKLCNRPQSNKPVMILTVGHASSNATVPKVAKIKKPIDQILTVMK